MTAARIFSEADQENFARWSGDWNPMHMDAVAARRTAAGAPVVHGVHLLLWALDEALRDEQLQLPFGIRADFRKFLFVGQRVSLERGVDRHGDISLRLLTDHGLVATVRIAPVQDKREPIVAPDGLVAIGKPQSPALEDMRRASGWLRLSEERGLGTAFHRLSDCVSTAAVAAIGQISRLVGMLCPGLHSILAKIDIDVVQSDESADGIRFRTRTIDERYHLVRMDVAGSGVCGAVEAFVRPKPVPPLSMSEAGTLVGPNQFADRRAFVVGGSRGLGAVTAKLLAAGGADVVITYASGAAEASEICEEICAHRRGSCAPMQLDVQRELAEQLAGLPWRPTHIYYFATPRIFLQKKAEFDREAFDRFVDFYVDAFASLCAHFAEGASEPLFVLYPSTVAVAERPPGLVEYAMAKASGELLCEELMRSQRALRIRVERLPRILTDQTASVQPVESASPRDIMLPLLM